MTTIYLIRHAEAEGNLYRRMHGQYDSMLTENGLRQVQALERRFAPVQIDACYASDLTRTCMTAQAICRPKHLPLRQDRRFREIHAGIWEDHSFGMLEHMDPVKMEQFNSDPNAWQVEGSETYEQFTGRFLEALYEVAARHDGQSVAIFTHGAILRGVQRRLFGGEPGHCDNTGVSKLIAENGLFWACYLNDSSHLERDASTLARQNWWRKGGQRADHNLWFQFGTACLPDYAALCGQTERAPALCAAAAAAAAQLPEALCLGMLREVPAGAMVLEANGVGPVGRILDLRIAPDRRGQHLAVQLIGQAVSVFRRQGKTALGVLLPPEDLSVRPFFERYGFLETARREGGIWLEKDIDVARARALLERTEPGSEIEYCAKETGI